MLRRFALLAVTVVTCALATTATETTRAGPPGLSAALGRALASPYVDSTRTAALAVDVSTGQVAYEANAGVALLPASAEKLAVSFAALQVLGPRYRFTTDVVGIGERTAAVWRGDLALVGRGDPTLVPSDLDGLARRVAATGIKRVTGDVLGDETHFDTRREAPGWKPSYLGIESRPLSALSVGHLEYRGANGSASAAVGAFVAALERRGVAVTGRPRVGRAPAVVEPVALDRSERLVEIVRLMNRESDNFVSEMVLKELGATLEPRGSSAAGARVVRTALAEADVPLAGVRIADGSGLSRFDRMTVASLVAILQAGAGDPAIRGPFVTSLAVAGISGTLEKRLERRPTRSRVIAKTGTTRRASALAGFIRRRYVFAILQNGSPVPYWSARAAQDRFVTILARA